MRITSNLKDYYDVGMAYGMDSDRTYRRYMHEVKGQGCGFPRFGYNDGKYNDDNGKRHLSVEATIVIGFCGKIYPCIQINPPKEEGIFGYTTTQERERQVFCYSTEHIEMVIKKHYTDEDFRHYQEAPKSRYKEQREQSKRNHWSAKQRRWSFNHFFNEIYNQEARNRLAKFFEEEVPIFIMEQGIDWKQHIIIFNGCLKPYNFMRIFDANIAFQELRMYMSNLAEPRKPIPYISDADLIEIKGFDPKFSFRKPKEKK